jgi:hypothetical protein
MCYWKIFDDSTAAINHQAAFLMEQRLNKRGQASLEFFIVGK